MDVDHSPAAEPPRQSPAARALLHALAFDPDETWLISIRRHRQPGVRVVDRQGQPLRFYTDKQLKALGEDASFVADYIQHIDSEGAGE